VGGIEVAGVVGCRAGSGGERRARGVGLELPANGVERQFHSGTVPIHSDFRGLIRTTETSKKVQNNLLQASTKKLTELVTGANCYLFRTT
jgi:hypothetical protein